MGLTYPPALMDPVRLAILAVVVFAWLLCVDHADRRIRLSPSSQPYTNLLVLLGGPIAWLLLLIAQRRARTGVGLSQWVESLAARLGRGKARGVNEDDLLIVLCKSDGTEVGRGLRGPLRDGRALDLAREIVDKGIEQRASDILLDPKADRTYQLRYRVDGLLREADWLDPQLTLGAMNCFKILAAMDIAERRRPQDGALLARRPDREVKLRVATAGTLYGEKMAVRLLDTKAALITLDETGMGDDYLVRLRKFITRPHGMMLVCGPTGSGKTTTLYASLSELGGAGRNIITIEDPIEYPLPIASQTAINPKAGITFATQLKHVLRQDPDVIMVGEIRDAETARIALQSSETGHLVFSTLHANDSLSGLLRLIDLGIEPYLVGAGLAMVCSQRLVRVLCNDCRQRAEISERLAAEAESRGVALHKVYRANPKGCDECGGSGYRGRTGIYEMLDISPEIGDMLVQRPSLPALTDAAKRHGMIAMRHDGIAKVLSGITSVEEVVRVTVS